MNKAVFLDRDGVLNRALVRHGKPYPPRNEDELEILSGVVDALLLLKDRGFFLFVVTNQPDVARGTLLMSELNALHEALLRKLRPAALDGIFACCHDDADCCECRKPKPGLLLRAAEEHGIDLSGSFMIGDRWRDIGAGTAAGCTTVWIDRGYNERKPEEAPDFVSDSLFSAARWITEKTV